MAYQLILVGHNYIQKQRLFCVLYYTFGMSNKNVLFGVAAGIGTIAAGVAWVVSQKNSSSFSGQEDFDYKDEVDSTNSLSDVPMLQNAKAPARVEEHYVSTENVRRNASKVDEETRRLWEENLENIREANEKEAENVVVEKKGLFRRSKKLV
jgi:hypothetical protein